MTAMQGGNRQTMKSFVRRFPSQSLMIFSTGGILTNVSAITWGIIENRLVIAADMFVANMIIFTCMFFMGFISEHRRQKTKTHND